MTFRIATIWLVVLAGGVASACQDEAPVATMADEQRYRDADAVVIGGEHIFTNPDGIRSARLVFDTMYQWRDSVDAELQEVDLTVFLEDGSERARVTSRRGSFDPRAERMVAREEVVLVIPGDDRRLETEELYYDPQAERIWSDSPFVMTEEGRTFRGSSFTSDLEFRNFQARGTGD